jgi:hypothetical protein
MNSAHVRSYGRGQRPRVETREMMTAHRAVATTCSRRPAGDVRASHSEAATDFVATTTTRSLQ